MLFIGMVLIAWGAALLAIGIATSAVKVVLGPALEDEKRAERRSIALLQTHLTPGQRLEFATEYQFTVRGCMTGRPYKLTRDTVFNVEDLWSGTRLCFGPVEAGYFLPIGDLLLAQKIMLECDEGTALAIANRLQQ